MNVWLEEAIDGWMYWLLSSGSILRVGGGRLRSCEFIVLRLVLSAAISFVKSTTLGSKHNVSKYMVSQT